MLAAVLALFTSVCYGTSNFVGPAISRDLPVYPVLIAGQAVAFAVSAAVLAVTQPDVPGTTVFLAAAAAGAGNAAGLICFYRAASLGPLSLVSPFCSLGVIVPVAAGVASGEPLGPLKLLGLLLAFGGVTLASRRAGGGAPAGHERAAAARKTVVPGTSGWVTASTAALTANATAWPAIRTG